MSFGKAGSCLSKPYPWIRPFQKSVKSPTIQMLPKEGRYYHVYMVTIACNKSHSQHSLFMPTLWHFYHTISLPFFPPKPPLYNPPFQITSLITFPIIKESPISALMANFVKNAMILLFFVMIVCGVCNCSVYKIGDSAGWAVIGNMDYNKWASPKSFQVGDTFSKFNSCLVLFR